MEIRDQRGVWDRRYIVSREQGFEPDYDPWLEPWIRDLTVENNLKVLDIGCGQGYDTRFFIEKGVFTVSCDFSIHALRLACTKSDAISTVLSDIREGLPFSNKSFDIVVANLSLHYFRWDKTIAILNWIRDVLRSDGILLARVNSTNDVNFGAESGEVVEHNLRLYNAKLKRFFDRNDIVFMLNQGWDILSLKEKVIYCYHTPKVIWEVAARRD